MKTLVFLALPLMGSSATAALDPLVRIVDLNPSEMAVVQLHDGSKANLKFIELQEDRDPLRHAVRQARVRIELNGSSLTLTSATYHLPVTAGGVRIDCPITRGYTRNSSKRNVWGLERTARFRLWPAGSPLLRPGTFGYPLRQRHFASDTQMANEPTFVDGGEKPGQTNIYYHYGLDFGGAEGLVDVIAATDGLVVSAADVTLPDHADSPAKKRYDVVYVVDGRGWYYRYSHLKRIDVKAGQTVRRGQQIGILGKEGGSGGWSHLHFDITSRQPSGQWGIQDGFAYVWEAWQNEFRPESRALVRPHHFIETGQTVTLDGGKSWSKRGGITDYAWTFSDGTRATGAQVKRRYDAPGTYSERLTITDPAGRVSTGFAVVQVQDPAHPDQLPPTIHAAYAPTFGIRAGDPVTFKVRTFRTRYGFEVWDFGDGSRPVTVHSDGNAVMHAPDGYAVTEHRYARPGHYVARVERSNERGEKAIGHVAVNVGEPFVPQTRISIREGRWHLNDAVTYPGTRAEGLLLNVRMVNATFEDLARPAFDPSANTRAFLASLDDYAAQGVRALTLNLQGGLPGYEDAVNSAFAPDGALRPPYLARVRRVIEACDRRGMAVILGLFYQRQDQVLLDEDAVRTGVVNAARWVADSGFGNVVLEIANEFGHGGFDHRLIRSAEGEAELIALAKRTAPGLLVSVSGLGGGTLPDAVAGAADFLLIHFNSTPVEEIPKRIAALRKYGKPVVCNEDDKTGPEAARAVEASVGAGASWGYMNSRVNQYFPLEFNGAADDPILYRKLRDLAK